MNSIEVFAFLVLPAIVGVLGLIAGWAGRFIP